MIDALFLVFMALAIYKGFTKGLIVGIFSFLAYFIGLAAALKLSSTVAQYVSGADKEPSVWMPALSFFMVFAAVVLSVNLLARIGRSVVKASMLGWADRIGGILFFVLIYLFIFSILLFYAVELKWLNDASTASSRVYPYIAPVAPAMVNLLGRIFPVFRDLFENLKMFFENLNTKIAGISLR